MGWMRVSSMKPKITLLKHSKPIFILALGNLIIGQLTLYNSKQNTYAILSQSGYTIKKVGKTSYFSNFNGNSVNFAEVSL
jgi:hypothetical protein